MENITICKNCQHLSTDKIGKHKNGTARECCEKPDYIPIREYIKNSIYRPDSSEIDLRGRIIGIVYSKISETEIINKIKAIL